jgi:cytochrome P450
MQNTPADNVLKDSLFNSDFFANPYPFYHLIRKNTPVYWDEILKAWIITRYSDVISGLRDTRLSANRSDTYMSMLPEAVQDELPGTAPLRYCWRIGFLSSN